MPVKILLVGGNVGLCAWFFFELVCIETASAVECIGMGAFLITTIFFVTMLVLTWESPHIRYGSQHCQIFPESSPTISRT